MFERAVLILSCILGYAPENFIAYKKKEGPDDGELIVQSRVSDTVYFLNKEQIAPKKSSEFHISNAYSGSQFYGSDSPFYLGKSLFNQGYEEFGRNVINNIVQYCGETYKLNDGLFQIKFHRTMGKPQLVNVTPVNISYDFIGSKMRQYILLNDNTRPLQLAEKKLHQFTPPDKHGYSTTMPIPDEAVMYVCSAEADPFSNQPHENAPLPQAEPTTNNTQPSEIEQEEKECRICFEDMNMNNMALFDCGHVHCKKCIEKIDVCSLCQKPQAKKIIPFID